MAGATRIITLNLKHFPARALQVHGILPVHPDEFVFQLVQEDEVTTRAVLEPRARKPGTAVNPAYRASTGRPE